MKEQLAMQLCGAYSCSDHQYDEGKLKEQLELQFKQQCQTCGQLPADSPMSAWWCLNNWRDQGKLVKGC